MFKKVVRDELERLVRRYFKKYNPKLIVVVGAVGKTTTKVSIATVLREAGLNVRCAEGNYNADMSTPLALLGVESPETGIHSVKTWLKIFAEMRSKIKHDNVPEVIIQELGTDHPGEIPHFGEYLKPDLAVVTSVAPEHMEFFKTIDAVAEEELSIFDYCDDVLVCADSVDSKYLKPKKYQSYGIKGCDYSFDMQEESLLEGYKGEIVMPNNKVAVEVKLRGVHILRAAVAAAAVADKLGVKPKHIAKGISALRPVSGRMNYLKGIKDSILIDDTYNSSPSAAEAALTTLYRIDAPQRIAVLGSMNELGETSEQSHRDLGNFCNSKKLDLVVTIGAEAKKYLAPAAKKQGNTVESFLNPIDAGEFVKKKLKNNAVVLLKGSQNGVYAEEATKVLLANPEDAQKLVRQSNEWKAKKSF